MSLKRTSGPWTIYDSSDPSHIKIKGQYPPHGGAHVAEVLGDQNAQLIAASPDMLAALKAALPIMSENMRDGLERGDGKDFEAVRMMRDAISKADGSEG